jgi:hypothetical protein
MLKDLGILLGGVFVGAVTAEIIRRKCPDVGKKVSTKICNATTGIKESFKAGYDNATRPHQRAETVVEPV